MDFEDAHNRHLQAVGVAWMNLSAVLADPTLTNLDFSGYVKAKSAFFDAIKALFRFNAARAEVPK